MKRLMIPLLFLASVCWGQTDKTPSERWRCDIDNSTTGNYLALAVDSTHRAWLTIVYEDRRGVPILSAQFHSINSHDQSPYDWEADTTSDPGGRLTIVWESGGYRLYLTPKDKSFHTLLTGECRKN
jgi:hypothetical protein